jgi:hypothetical protein
MVAHIYTVAFQGIEAREVDVQVHVANQTSVNNPFSIVGLADKAVAESRERVRAALSAIGLALPHQKITINLAPADLPKEGSHYDLPIALGLLAAMGVLPASEMAHYTAMGELSLDAQITPVAGVLPAALAASEAGRGLICPVACGPEAAGRHGNCCSTIAHRHRQPHERRAGVESACGKDRYREWHYSRSTRCEGAGDGEACARNRGSGRPQHAEVVVQIPGILGRGRAGALYGPGDTLPHEKPQWSTSLQPHFQEIVSSVEPLNDQIYGPLYRCELALKGSYIHDSAN